MLQESIEDSLDAVGKSKLPNAQKYREANAFYRAGVEKYKQGATREVLRKGGHGEPYQILDSDVADKYFHSGKRATEDAQEFVSKVGLDRESMDLMNDHIRNKIHAIMPDGNLTTKRVQAFRNRYKEALRSFPEADKMLSDLIANRRNMDDAIQAQEVVAKHVESNLTKLYLNADPDRVISSTLSGKSPIKDFNKAWNMVRGDVAAENGLRQGFLDFIEKRTLSAGEDITGKKWITPAAFTKLKEQYGPIFNKFVHQTAIKSIG